MIRNPVFSRPVLTDSHYTASRLTFPWAQRTPFAGHKALRRRACQRPGVSFIGTLDQAVPYWTPQSRHAVADAGFL